jgi:predicted DCC family thiol-disulfide oxidoreductase YuxK
VQFVIKRDIKNIFDFISLQSEEGRKLINEQFPDLKNYDSILLVINNSVLIKSEAVLEILNIIGGPWKLFLAFRIIPRKLRDWLYDIVAKSRYKIFGTRQQCFVPKSYNGDS